jgi:hypothetical protein
VFKDALFVVPKWKAQALVAEMFAAAQLSLEKQRKELAQQHLSREKELKELAQQHLSREKELKELAQQQLSREKELAQQQLSREKELKEQHLSREKELAEQQLSREKELKELAQQQLSREKELTQQQLSREKELAEQQLSREKELTAREKQLTEQNKELTEQKVSMTDKLARLEENLQVAQTEVLRSKGLLTSRGVLEMALIQVHNECKLKGKFRAQKTCFYLGKAKSTEQTAAWKLKKCHQEARDKHPHSNLLDESVGKAYSDLYGLLSEKIHGHPWSGESVRHPTCCDTLEVYLCVAFVLYCTLS